MTTPDAGHGAPVSGPPAPTAAGHITAAMIGQTFPHWRIFHDDGTWWATRGGLEEQDGPRSLIRRVHASADLTVLAGKLCAQDWLDHLDDGALAAVYHGVRPSPGHYLAICPGLDRQGNGRWRNGQAASLQARQLQAAYPGWTIRPVRRRGGTGLEAVRDQPGLVLPDRHHGRSPRRPRRDDAVTALCRVGHHYRPFCSRSTGQGLRDLSVHESALIRKFTHREPGICRPGRRGICQERHHPSHPTSAARAACILPICRGSSS